MNKTEIKASRFWPKVDKSCACWEWTAGRYRDGYGRFNVAGAKQLAHRVSWVLLRGPIPPGKMVLHHCDNPPCVNPDHLYIGDQSDNMRDMMERNPRRWKGARKGERNPNSKLLADDVVEIRKLISMGVKYRMIASMFNVSKSCVTAIATERSWR